MLGTKGMHQFRHAKRLLANSMPATYRNSIYEIYEEHKYEESLARRFCSRPFSLSMILTKLVAGERESADATPPISDEGKGPGNGWIQFVV